MRKFAFETEFAPDGRVVKAAPAAGPRRLTPEEIEAERAAAYARGKEDALAAAERAAAKALADLAANATALLQRLERERRAMREEGAALALAAARKISGDALVAFGEARALAAIEAAMEAMRHGPRLIVRLPAATAETIGPRIEALRAEHAYAGAIVVRADPALATGGVQIDWSDGVVTLDPNEVAQRIDALVTAALASAEAGDAP